MGEHLDLRQCYSIIIWSPMYTLGILTRYLCIILQFYLSSYTHTTCWVFWLVNTCDMYSVYIITCQHLRACQLTIFFSYIAYIGFIHEIVISNWGENCHTCQITPSLYPFVMIAQLLHGSTIVCFFIVSLYVGRLIGRSYLCLSILP